MSELILALDFGGTKLSAALTVRGERQWQALERSVSPPDADAAHDYRTVCALARKLLDRQQPAAIGVSFGGPVIADAGIVRLSHHVPGWEDNPLAARLASEFGVAKVIPIAMDNDANAAALGEYRYGAGQGCHSLLYITVSTGVGGGWILNDSIWHGFEGMAGEFGHSRVDPHGPDCVCGGHGCIESLASGLSIARRAIEKLEAEPGQGRILRDLAGAEQTLSAQQVSEAAALGDALAWSVLEAAAVALGIGIGSTANLMNPQRFVLGGGVTKSGERFWEALRRAAREVAMPEVSLDIVPAAFLDDAPLWGAVALAEDRLALGRGREGVGVSDRL